MSGVGSAGYPAFISPAIQQFQQNLFSQIDTNGDGAVSQSELEQAVTQAGGNSQAADALYSLINPGNSAGFDEQQFAQALPGSALSDQVQAQMIGYQAQGWPRAGAPAAGSGNSGGTGSTGGNAQDALTALMQSFNPPAGSGTATGNSAQDAIVALLKGTDGSSNGGAGASAAALFNSVDLARAFSLYQSQLEQQVLNSISVMQSAIV
jgi:hypothetical protein